MSTFKTVLARLNSANLKINPAKLKVLRRSLRTLGRVADKDGLSIDPAKRGEVLAWEFPPSAEKMRSFMGVAGFLRPHIHRFAELARPLDKARSSEADYQAAVAETGPEMKEAFESLKQAISTAPLAL